MFLSNGDADTERQYIQELLAYKIEGLIILSHAIPSMELANLHIPIVAIEREDAHISSINTDNYMGAIQATSLLYRHNCEVLFHINNPTAKMSRHTVESKGLRIFAGNSRFHTASFSMR